MKKHSLLICTLVYVLCASATVYAYAPTKPSLGDIAENIVGVELATHSFLKFLFVTCGVGLIASSMYHFKLWTQNRQHRPFSRPLLFLIFGLALIALVYIPVPLPK